MKKMIILSLDIEDAATVFASSPEDNIVWIQGRGDDNEVVSVEINLDAHTAAAITKHLIRAFSHVLD